MPRATAWLDALLPNSSIEQWRMVVIVLDIRCLWRHNMTSYSRLEPTFWRSLFVTQLSYSGTPEQREGKQQNSWGQWKILCLFLFINNVDLKNNNINYRKPFWIFLSAWISTISLFQVDLDKPQDYLWYCYEKQCWLKLGKRARKSFDVMKIWAKSLKIRIKMARNVAWLYKMAPKVCRKTHKDLLLRSHKKRLHVPFWEKICRQKLHKNFFGQFGEIRGKILCIPKNLLAPTPV